MKNTYAGSSRRKEDECQEGRGGGHEEERGKREGVGRNERVGKVGMEEKGEELVIGTSTGCEPGISRGQGCLEVEGGSKV